MMVLPSSCPVPRQRCSGRACTTRRTPLSSTSLATAFSNDRRALRTSGSSPLLSLAQLPALGSSLASPPAHLARRQLLANLLAFPALGSIASTLNPSNATAATLVEEVVIQAPLEEPPSPSTSTPEPEYCPTRVTATGRVVAIGDLHGDWSKAVESLMAAGVITVTEGSQDIVWSGGDTVVVQLGDVMDRGDNEIAIVMLLRNLHEQAQQQGGAVYMLNGNHESLNVCGDFRYVTPGAFVESGMYAGLGPDELKDWSLLARVRNAVYRPGGPMAQELSKNPTVLMVNDTVFAHGGLLPVHVQYGIERLNREVSAWMRAEEGADGGKALPPYLAMGGANSVMWNRSLSREMFPSPHDRYTACRALSQALEKIGATRLVVGHTPQLSGANCECDGSVWRIDVGMSSGVLNRPVQVLQIAKDPATGQHAVTVLSDMQEQCCLEEQGVEI